MHAAASQGLQLVEVRPPHRIAFQAGKASLAALLGVSIPEGWPMFPVALSLPRNEGRGSPDWPAYFFICPESRSLVGNGGFKGPPNEQGEVEIGYEVAPMFRNRGWATAAVSRLLVLAFARPEARAVVAHTLAETNPSNAVLRKAGMTFHSSVPHGTFGAVWRWRILRADHRPQAAASWPARRESNPRQPA